MPDPVLSLRDNSASSPAEVPRGALTSGDAGPGIAGGGPAGIFIDGGGAAPAGGITAPCGAAGCCICAVSCAFSAGLSSNGFPVGCGMGKLAIYPPKAAAPACPPAAIPLCKSFIHGLLAAL